MFTGCLKSMPKLNFLFITAVYASQCSAAQLIPHMEMQEVDEFFPLVKPETRIKMNVPTFLS